MKSFAIVAAFLLGLSAVHAARPLSEKVLEEIERVRPRFKQIQDFVIHTISDARFKSSEQLAKFHSDVLLVKQTFVIDAIKKEDALLFQVDNQPSTVDTSCLSFIKTLADSVMNLSGTGFSTCITEASDSLEKVISAFYALLQLDETEYIGIGLLDVFKGENIFYSPESILYKLQQKAVSMEGYPAYLEDDLIKTVNNLGSNLESLEMAYIGCMTTSEQMLKDGFTMAQNHMSLTCRAVQVPVSSSHGSDVDAVETIVVPEGGPLKAEAVRRFRERFGL
ncbi:uncharacterized protein LOC135706609 [Ochlerotatus camptorhynchus]|uniref:uncharacterized protein LOC135706609 n=1 Tax=Ochlerotatus camptorhynchus TaxID=644619 RepID=UPI0031E3A3B8